MPMLNRQYCTRCKESVFNRLIDGVRVPLVFYFVVGIPDDVGEVDINAPGLKVPSFVREIMQTALPRIELCMQCVAEVFGVALVTAAEDEMYDANNNKIADALELGDANLPKVEMFARMHHRVLHAIAVGQGRATVEDLPPEYRAPTSAPPPDPAAPIG